MPDLGSEDCHALIYATAPGRRISDTGLRTTHIDFNNRTIVEKNYTSDNNGNPDKTADGHGHGTNVTGIIAANHDHTGVATGVGVLPIKVLDNMTGSGDFSDIAAALHWIVDEQLRFNISAVCMSLSDGNNHGEDIAGFVGDSVQSSVRGLRQQNVAVVVASGNDYFTHDSKQGMGYPAILRETVSVGAVYDADEGPFSYNSGGIAFATAADRVTPFSQRLHPSVNPDAYTDIFAPGAPVKSAGISNDRGESIQHGTSQAAPVITGVILLMQEFYLRHTGLDVPVRR